MDHFEGYYKDRDGKCHDLRPHSQEGLDEFLTAKLKGEKPQQEVAFKPTLANFRKLEPHTLKKVLLLALREQLKELKSDNHEAYDILFENKLKKKIGARIQELTDS